jgi:hypothetical protein
VTFWRLEPFQAVLVSTLKEDFLNYDGFVAEAPASVIVEG